MEKMNNSLISIIIPAYNCEMFINQVITCLTKQTIKNFEIIWINDGSKDNSLEVAREELEKSGLKYEIINQENSGVSVARNIGLKKATGKYIYFLDSDDKIENIFCERIAEIVNEYDVDVVLFDYTTINNGKEYNGKNNYSCFDIVKDSKDILIDLFEDNIRYHMCAFVVKKEIIEKNKISFTVNSKYGEDHEFIIKTISSCKNGIVVKDRLFKYFKNNTSVTKIYNISRLDSIESAIRVRKFIEGRFKETCMDKLATKYVASKIVYNIHQYVLFSDYNDMNLTNELMKKIMENRSSVMYYSYKEVNIKKIIKEVALYISPVIYIKLLKFLKFLKLQIKGSI